MCIHMGDNRMIYSAWQDMRFDQQDLHLKDPAKMTKPRIPLIALLLVFAALLSAVTSADASDVDMHLSATTIKVGQPLVVTLKSKKLCNFQLRLEDAKNQLIEKHNAQTKVLTPPIRDTFTVNKPGHYWIFMDVLDLKTCGDAADYDVAREFSVVEGGDAKAK